jgi:hypothetical protein
MVGSCAMADGAKPDTDWGEVKLDYEMRGHPIRKICETHGISERALYAKVREEDWILRRPASPCGHFIDRRAVDAHRSP